MLKKVEDALKTAGSVVDDTVLQPPKEFVEEYIEAVQSPKAIEDIIKEAGRAIDEPVQVAKEAAEAVYEPLGADVNFETSSVDLDIPSVDLDTFKPSFSLAVAQPQPTKGVTESVFEDFLFEKKYQAPELIQRTVPLSQYTVPQGMFRNIV